LVTILENRADQGDTSPHRHFSSAVERCFRKA
jgi:hypothetical protein